MSESLGDLLRRSADAVPEPRVDVGELVASAGRRQRRRRLAVVATAAAAVGVIVVGSLAVRGGQPRGLEPAPSPSPSPSVVDLEPTGERPLVYAAGATVHVGDDSFKAGGTVVFLDATDDGVVFMTEDSHTLWFYDGSTTEAIGRVPASHVGEFEVWTAKPGSLVVWEDATSRTGQYFDRFVVYDTSRHEVVTRLPMSRPFDVVLDVTEAHVYFNPGEDPPGCTPDDPQNCEDKRLLRYDVASGTTERISKAIADAEQRDHAAQALGLGERFELVGRRLVPAGVGVTLPTGEPVSLRVPAGYRAPGDGIPLVQWLDDDRFVLFANEARFDSPHEVGDLLECRLSNSRCRVAVRASSTPYVAPGSAW